MKVLSTAIQGVRIVETTPRSDSRGVFTRLFCESELQSVIAGRRVVQVNLSLTRGRGALRGMHFQNPPHAEMKLIRCVRGRIWDVAVDLRAGSPTLLQSHAEELSADNARMMIIPEGCAHGFQAMEQDSELLYLHTAFYHPEAEGGVPYDDPRLAIPWPLPVTEVSARDRQYPRIPEPFNGIEL